MNLGNLGGISTFPAALRVLLLYVSISICIKAPVAPGLDPPRSITSIPRELQIPCPFKYPGDKRSSVADQKNTNLFAYKNQK
jgi:hypothetical protein